MATIIHRYKVDIMEGRIAVIHNRNVISLKEQCITYIAKLITVAPTKQDKFSALLRRMTLLEVLETDIPLDARKLVANKCLQSIDAQMFLSRISDEDCEKSRTRNETIRRNRRTFLTSLEFRLIMTNIPQLTELRCDIIEILHHMPLKLKTQEDFSRLTSLFLGTSNLNLTAALDKLNQMCPNIEELVIHISASRDLFPLRRLKRLTRLKIRYALRTIGNFLDDSVFDILGEHLCGRLLQLELPLQSRFCPKTIGTFCPKLEVLRTKSFFRGATPDSPWLLFLKELAVDSTADFSALAPICPNIERLEMTMSELTYQEAQEISIRCRGCRKLTNIKIIMSSNSVQTRPQGNNGFQTLFNIMQQIPNITVLT